jgi:hypothetical protein
MNFRGATFDWGFCDEVLWIADLNGPRSVTRAIQDVLDHIAAQGTCIPRRIVYRDLGGCWDGVLVRDGIFRSFVGLGAKSLRDAVQRARRSGKFQV